MNNSAVTDVCVTEKRHAKIVKSAFEKEGALDKSFRLCNIDDSYEVKLMQEECLSNCDVLQESSKYIALPIHKEKIGSFLKNKAGSSELQDAIGLIQSYGVQLCRFSSAVMGNSQRQLSLTANNDLNAIQNIVLQTIAKNEALIQQRCVGLGTKIENMVRALSKVDAPPKLEMMGDDRTLVIPYQSLNVNTKSPFQLLVYELFGTASNEQSLFLSSLWEELARLYRSQRVVRRGEIDPNSKVRESGHCILWINHELEKSFTSDYGPGSRGWITVTEQGIKQSLDLTKVMFSRGNISEKIRFGKLVKEGELVLDMYTGIGYYSLPALVIGKARHVYSCEWNPHAACFLRYNLKQNGVSDRATVLEGDSRIRLEEENVLDLDFDRISLGLLPSSEGGWKTAVKAIRKDPGGWLHVHANVPAHEHEEWALWMCRKISKLCQELNEGSACQAHVICNYIEKVKSFAPKVDHVVADVYVGTKIPSNIDLDDRNNVGIFNRKREFIPSSIDIRPPSCALGNGVLDQEWML